jgi:fumarate hydratase subunit beta
MHTVGLEIPLREAEVRKLRIGDRVWLTGIVYITRDLGHRRIVKSLVDGTPLPVVLEGGVIYHAGPVVKEQNGKWEIVNCGPTSSPRMNPYSPQVIEAGVRALVGKGSMDIATVNAMRRKGALFLAAYSLANIHAQYFKEVLDVHWLDLGTTEALWVVRVEQWGPLIVAMDSFGNNLYRELIERARRWWNEYESWECPSR